MIVRAVVDPLGGAGGAHPPKVNQGGAWGGCKSRPKAKILLQKSRFFVKSVTFHLILLKSKHMLPIKQKALTRAQNL